MCYNIIRNERFKLKWRLCGELYRGTMECKKLSLICKIKNNLLLVRFNEKTNLKYNADRLPCGGICANIRFCSTCRHLPLCALWKGCDADIDEEIKILLTDGIFTKTKKYYTRRKRNE